MEYWSMAKWCNTKELNELFRNGYGGQAKVPKFNEPNRHLWHALRPNGIKWKKAEQ